MLTNDCFGADYQEARCKFLEAARACGAALETVRHPERGPDGGELFTDIARIGPADAEAMLVMISATHGVGRLLRIGVRRLTGCDAGRRPGCRRESEPF
ncbi:MAG: DUF2817 domain-containing protein [Aliidongia sp.]